VTDPLLEILAGTAVTTAVILLLTMGLLLARRALVPEGAATVTVNGAREVEARRGDGLLSVLHGAGIAVPAGCGGNGTCGLCRVTVEGEGAGEPKATERGVLSAAERRAHVRLACQVSLRGPVEVEVPGDALEAGALRCRVRSNRMLAPLIRELVLELPEGAVFPFKAGDFAQLSAPPYALDFAELDVDPEHEEAWRVARWRGLKAGSDAVATRAYSLANRPRDAGTLVFDIRLAVPPPGREAEVPPGVVSSWLFARAPGDAVEASGPFGHFHARPTGREMVFVGGGVGMAPLRAMIHAELARGEGRRIRYLYGARSRADLFYGEEFDALADRHPGFSWTPVLSDPAPGDRWRGETGFVHEALRRALAGHPAPEGCEYYLCGPPVMIAAVNATLARLGVDPSAILYDDFGSQSP
jgi:Na+-transporting NADH:ubiquinone oxidoreductase subunit F